MVRLLGFKLTALAGVALVVLGLNGAPPADQGDAAYASKPAPQPATFDDDPGPAAAPPAPPPRAAPESPGPPGDKESLVERLLP